ncbi:MAG: hypothetical protein ACOC8S_08090, partial [Bacteroidota bacterium]
MQTQPQVPAGINKNDHRCEIYSHDDKPHATYMGKSIKFNELPAFIRKYYFSQFLQDAVALESLEKDMGLHDIKEKFYRWILCNYGGFDFEPDFDDNGDNSRKEYWDCGCRGNCPAEGKVCKPWVMTHYHLSKREIEILKH